MDEIKAKQQVVEKIKENSKILVTVSDNPSVDALSAALALAMILDKQEKYATAIFSGETPPAIAFLEPEKTFDDTTDSLRDFIIALNKEKADHLRYKLDGDSVKIFITPYRTTITQDDLEFSQGDYNVELVIALGVDNQNHLDHALEKGGQILHDATIVTMTTGSQTSDLGGIDWHDSDSSSLSEMVAGLAEALKENKSKKLLDESIATALLTGIVAETDRFSNEHTSSRTMTVAASLMAAGADQQLVATKLQEAVVVEAEEESEAEPIETEEPVVSRSSSRTDADEDAQDADKTPTAPADATLLSIEHDETLADIDRRIRGEEAAKKKIADEEAARTSDNTDEDSSAIHEDSAPNNVASNDTTAPREPSIGDVLAGAIPQISHVVSNQQATDTDDAEPTFGGTLNATTDQAADDARQDADNDQNKVILSHSAIGSVPGVNLNLGQEMSAELASAYAPAADELMTPPVAEPEPEPVVPASPTELVITPPVAAEPQPQAEPAPVVASASEPAPVQEPEPPVQSQPESQPQPQPAQLQPEPQAPAATPADLGLPLPPPIPDFSQFNGAVSMSAPLSTDAMGASNAAIDMTANAVPAADTAYAYAAAEPAEVPVPAPAATEVTAATEASQEAALDAIVQPPIAVQTQAPSIPFPVQPSQAYAPVASDPQPAAPAGPVDPGQYQIPTQQ